MSTRSPVQLRPDTIRRPRVREKTLGEQTASELSQTVQSALIGVAQRITDITRHYRDPETLRLHTEAITQQLATCERAIHLLATSEEPDANNAHSQAAESFFITVSDVERLLNAIDEYQATGVTTRLENPATPSPVIERQLVDTMDRLELALPRWTAALLAPELGFPQQEQYMFDSPDSVEEDEVELDERYEELMTGSPSQRRPGLENILMPLLLRAAKYREDDPTDKEGNCHRLNNALAHLHDDWADRYPFVARKYAVLQRYVDNLAELVEAFYFGDAGMGDQPVEPSPEDGDEYTEAVSEVEGQFHESLTAVHDLLFRLRQDHRSRGRELKMEIEDELREAHGDLVWLTEERSVTQAEVERLEHEFMRMVLRTESVINAVDAARQKSVTKPVSEQWAPLSNTNARLNQLTSLVEQAGVDLPAWAIEYLARDVAQLESSHAYMHDQQTAAIDRRQDEEFTRLMTDTPLGSQRRLRLHRLFEEYLLRAVKSYAEDFHDNSGEQDRCRQLALELREEWEARLPVVAVKYEQLTNHWDDLMATLVAHFYPNRLPDPVREEARDSESR